MPLQRYEEEIRLGNLLPDAEQRAVMRKLHAIGDELVRRSNWKAPSRSLFARWIKPRDQTVPGIKGLYLWGGVGRGKTQLCDLFFEALPFEDKKRLHFHSFMQQIHDELKSLGGVDDPLVTIADSWAKKTRLLLLDEMHVNDITDAMLLGTLLTEMFRRGVTLVTTSNVAPDDLYKDGLQRARFLPAIAQIRNNTEVLEMIGVTDYRLRILQKEPIYCVSRFANGKAMAKTQQLMQSHFDRLITDTPTKDKNLSLNGRDIPYMGRSSDLIWFSFDALCNGPRSTHDYIEIATLFTTVLISDIPVMDEDSNDAARRFVNLVDEFYDRKVKLVVSAEAPADKLYSGKRLAFEFQRAASRLFEMQTTEYLASKGSDHES